MNKQGQKHISVPKGNLIRLQQYMGKRVIVRFAGGRQICGLLKSYDRAINLAFDQTIETLPSKISPDGQKRQLGFVIVRGALIQTIGPEDGTEQIENPFTQQ